MAEEKPNMMDIFLDDGSKITVQNIVSFELATTGKEYLVYTLDEKDEVGNVKIYVSVVNYSDNDPENGEMFLTNIEDEGEWDQVKDVLKDLSTE